jgi:hypothetical protein
VARGVVPALRGRRLVGLAIALAAAARAVLVSGDGHLTVLAGQIPVRTPAAFLAELEGSSVSEPG